ncbi:cytochrome P450 6k1-like [Anabrus simplex]|uniref:cytochrome P450 6k1-like n=1 Tax=Anabrus simplex TaxID=316456 RepID=UPI0035A2B808
MFFVQIAVTRINCSGSQLFIFSEEILLIFLQAGAGQPILGYYQIRTPILLVRDPEIIKKVLVTNFDSFQETYYVVDKNLDPLVARCPLMLSGDVWRGVRSLEAPAFTLGRVVTHFPTMALESREIIKYLETEAPKHRPGGLEVRDLTCKFTTDVVVRCGFGVYGNSFTEADATLRKLAAPTVGVWKAIRFTLHSLIPKLPEFLRVRYMELEDQSFFQLLIKELILYRETKRVFRNDYLQMLMHIKCMGNIVKGKNTIRIAGVNLDYNDEDIASHALNLLHFGCELPSFILTLALYELASNPEIQTRLRAEIDVVLMRYSGGLTYEAVQEMSYLDMVLNETLRKYPPFQFLTRVCTRSCQLPLRNGESFILEKGTAVLIPLEGLQMDPEHFPNPEQFDPERFSEERRATIKPFSYIPYGVGPRQCFGMKFADAEMKAGLVTIISHFEVFRTPRTAATITKDPFTSLFDNKGGMWLDFVRRK